MSFSPQIIHDLVALSARISAIISLTSHPETRRDLDLKATDKDMRKALDELRALWIKTIEEEKQSHGP